MAFKKVSEAFRGISGEFQRVSEKFRHVHLRNFRKKISNEFQRCERKFQGILDDFIVLTGDLRESRRFWEACYSFSKNF